MKKEDKNKLFALGLFLLLAIGISVITLVDVITDEPFSDDDLHFDKPEMFFLNHSAENNILDLSDMNFTYEEGWLINQTGTNSYFLIKLPTGLFVRYNWYNPVGGYTLSGENPVKRW